LIYTSITDAGLEHIKGLPGLTILYLGGTGVTNAGLSHLRALAGLRELTLEGTRVTDAGLADLKGPPGADVPQPGRDGGDDAGGDLAALKGLTRIQVRRTGMTAQGLKKFHAAVRDA